MILSFKIGLGTLVHNMQAKILLKIVYKSLTMTGNYQKFCKMTGGWGFIVG